MVNTLSLLALATGAIATTFTVQVGQSGDTFSPATVTAAVGDIVTFQFDGEHDVASSAFGSPCTADNNIYSGMMSTGEFSVKINSTDPIWYFCSVSHHCQVGMVGVINPPSSGDTLNSYKSAAQGTSSSSGGNAVAGGIVGGASLFGESGSASSASSTSTAAASSAAGSFASSASSATSASGAAVTSSTPATATSAGSPTGSKKTSAGSSTGSTKTSASATAQSSGAADSVKAFGYAGVAAMAAAILA